MAQRPARILIVDHRGQEAAAVQRCVAGADRIVVVAEETCDLMATLAEFSPHLVLLVAESNVAICPQCRELKRSLPGILVMATCDFSGLHEIEQLAEAGVDDFLSNPTDDAELRHRVDNLLRLAGCL
jgi:DNA-binding response OmpR family regulator